MMQPIKLNLSLSQKAKVNCCNNELKNIHLHSLWTKRLGSTEFPVQLNDSKPQDSMQSYQLLINYFRMIP